MTDDEMFELVDAVMTGKAHYFDGHRWVCPHTPEMSASLEDFLNLDYHAEDFKIHTEIVEPIRLKGHGPRWGEFDVCAGKCSTCGKVYGKDLRFAYVGDLP